MLLSFSWRRVVKSPSFQSWRDSCIHAEAGFELRNVTVESNPKRNATLPECERSIEAAMAGILKEFGKRAPLIENIYVYGDITRRMMGIDDFGKELDMPAQKLKGEIGEADLEGLEFHGDPWQLVTPEPALRLRWSVLTVCEARPNDFEEFDCAHVALMQVLHRKSKEVKSPVKLFVSIYRLAVVVEYCQTNRSTLSR